jgi:cold shock CspA family protein
MNGVIKNVQDRGFGFIRSEGAVEYFFHRDDFLGHWDDLRNDIASKKVIRVEFEEMSSKRGPRAANVKRTDWPNEG